MIVKQKKNGLEDKGNVTFFTTIKYIHIKNKWINITLAIGLRCS